VASQEEPDSMIFGVRFRTPNDYWILFCRKGQNFLQYVSHNMKLNILQNITFMYLPFDYTIWAQFFT
jgi:hypothetical protein